MKQLKISVITPSFNSGEHIERAIKSVMAQDYTNWEHIIMDGGSTDETLDILKKYPHLKWVSEPDKGQADAMNKGFDRSEGEIIVYLNADDYFLERAFSSVIAEFEKGAKFVMGDVLVKSPRLGTEYVNTPRHTLEGMLRHWEPNAFSHNPVGYFYLREVQESCPFNKDNYATMDLEFLLEVAARYPIVKIDRVLGCYEDGIGTKTQKTQMQFDYWNNKTFPYIEKHLPGTSPEFQEQFAKDQRIGYAQCQAHMNRLSAQMQEAKIDEKKFPSVSVIIPTYNCAAYVCRAVDSVLAQNIEKIEILVIDDASTDGTEALLSRQYGNNEKVRIIRHERNKKLGAARNTGLSRATKEFIFFLDADDWLQPGALRHLLHIECQTNADVVACGARKTWDEGKSEPYHRYAFSCSGGHTALEYYSEYLIGSIVWNKLYRRQLLEMHSISFNEEYWHEDVLFTAKVIYACDSYVSIADEYVNYYQRDGSIVNTAYTPLHLASYLKLFTDFYSFGKQNGLFNDEKGKRLYLQLIRAHCSNEVVPKVLKYMQQAESKQRQKNLMEAATRVMGEGGIALADFLSVLLDCSSGVQVAEQSTDYMLPMGVKKVPFLKRLERSIRKRRKKVQSKFMHIPGGAKSSD